MKPGKIINDQMMVTETISLPLLTKAEAAARKWKPVTVPLYMDCALDVGLLRAAVSDARARGKACGMVARNRTARNVRIATLYSDGTMDTRKCEKQAGEEVLRRLRNSAAMPFTGGEGVFTY